jgi:YD repeat-containing protein
MNSLTLRTLLSLALIFGLATMGYSANTPPATVPPSSAVTSADTTTPSSCNNIETQCFDCQGNLLAPGTPNPCYCNSFSSNHGSLIDELSYSHLHTAIDILNGQVTTSGCTTCGSTGGASYLLDAAGLLPLQLVRTHRFRDMTQHSSFGPGVYGSYDVSLRISRYTDGTWQVVMTDPGLRAPVILADSGGGLFKGPSWNIIRGLQFFSGPAGSGSAVTDPSQAQSAVLTAFQGYRYVFDIFNPYGTLPSPWVEGDIGGSSSHGTAGFANGVFSLSASGGDIWNTADQFGYVYQAVTGDCTITAQVTALSTYRGLAADGSNPWAKAGVMIRETLDAGSTSVNCFVTPGNGACYQSRPSTGASTVTNGQTGGVVAPKWVRLQRQGSVITGSISSDGVTWSTVASSTVAMNQVVFAGLSLTSHNNGVLSAATYANVSVTGTPVAPGSWPIPVTAPYTAGALAGRLSQILDRNGYGIQIAYQSFTPTQLQQSPDLAWEMNTATDSHGRQMTFHYNATQVSGRWVISSVTAPNGAIIQYSYTNGLLTGVAFPDGTSSVFTYAPDAAGKCTVAGYDDAAADGTHRRKQVYLTNNFSATITTTDPYLTYNQASNLVRLILDGNGDVTYLNFSVNSLVSQHYDGTGVVRQITKLSAAIKSENFSSWTFDPSAGFTGTLDPNSVVVQYANDNLYRQGTPTQSTDEQGVVRTYGSNADGITNSITYSDGTKELLTYNAFTQLTRFQDRLNRVTRYTYDTQGNLTLKEEGILFNGTTDVNQPEYAAYAKSYYPAGDPNQYLLKSETDANGNVTTYTYTPAAANGSNHFLATIVTPNDAGTGTLTAWTFAYDAFGRKTSSTDAVNRQSFYTYDSRDRLVKTTYSDSSTDIVVWGSGADKNLVHQRKDRQGTLTEFTYDADGRCTVTTVGANTMSADGSTVTPVDPTQNATQSLAVQTICTFLTGTDLKASCSTNGNLVQYGYDYRQRVISQTAYPTNSSPGLTTAWLYATNLLVQVTDPYGRNTYSVYRPSDVQMIRSVKGLVPADGVGGVAGAATIARSTAPNPTYLVTDFTLDAVGQRIAVIDPRAITSTTTFDTRGRVTKTVQASSDSTVAATTQYAFDAQSNVLTIQSPRFSISSDTGGYQKDQITKTYTHRNLLLTQTAASGAAEAGTQTFTYYNDGRIQTRADERGDAWTTVWMRCCARIGSQVDPSVADVSPASNYQGVHVFDYNNYGDQTQEYVVKLPAGTQLPGCCDGSAPTGTVVTETTTAYDVRHRPIFRTVWLQPLGAIDNNNPPIAGQNGIPSSQGLTTAFRYDDNLADALGLSNPADANSVAPYLTGLGFGANADGRAMVVINPAGEPSWTIYDGLGRVVRVVDGNGNATTTTYDIVDTNGLVDTTVTDALGHAVVKAQDAAGWTRSSADQLGFVTTQSFDADGNVLSVRDPNAVGQDCLYDSRNRRTQCTDTAGAVTQTGYDFNNNVTAMTDGLGHVTSMAFDARDRKVATTDRLGGVTRFVYDSTSNLLTITDAQGAVTTYTYDARNLLLSETYPPGQATPGSPTTPPLDQRLYVYDAARRLTSRSDQAGVLTSYVYDLASRLDGRLYSDGLGNDAFGYDPASRLILASSGRYGTTVTRSYTDNGEKAGRLTSEVQLVSGISESVAYAYDAANRPVGVTYPTGSPVARTFTNRNQLSSVAYAGNAIASAITYDNGMRRISTALGNGLTESRTYRADNLVASIQVPGVTNYAYSYDADKNVTLEANGLYAAENESFAFDTENRVTGWQRDGIEAQNWTLSLVGDWTSTARTGPNAFSQTRTHSPVHETTQVVFSGGPTIPLTYDTKGNLQSAPGFSAVAQWDDENRLATATVGAAVNTYAYDALGRRLQKTAGGLVTTFVHDGAQVVSEYVAPVYQSQDIGSPTIAGSFSDNGAGTVTLAGSGTDVWGTSDQFRFAYRSLTGDGSITALVATQTNTDPWAKAGVMIRGSLDPAAAHAFMAVTPGNGEAFQRRNTAGGASTNTQTGGGTGAAPYWVRLVRAGSTLTGYRSADGVTWSLVGSDTVTLPTTVYIGYAVCAHTNAALSTVTFTNGSTTGAVVSTTVPVLARSYVYGSYVDEPLALITGSGGPSNTSYLHHDNRVYSVAALTNSSGAVVERYRYDSLRPVGQCLAADSVTSQGSVLVWEPDRVHWAVFGWGERAVVF